MKTRTLAIFLSLTLVLLCFLCFQSTPAQAAKLNSLTYTISGGEVTITDCDNTLSGELIIPATIEGCPVTGIGDRAFKDCTSLTSITISDSVSSIGEEVFYGCKNLAEIVIGDSLTDIGYRAFYNCTGLNSITVSADNPSYYSDSYGALYNKDQTRLIRMPSGYSGAYVIPHGVTGIEAEAFAFCNVTDVTIPESITCIGKKAFSQCYFTSVTIPDSVTSIENYAFSDCYYLTKVTIPSSVNYMGWYVFRHCDRLGNIFFLGDAPEGLSEGHCILYRCYGTRVWYHKGNAGWPINSVTLSDAADAIIIREAEHICFKDTLAETCTTAGTEPAVCLVCGEEYTRVVTGTGHKYNAYVVLPDCTSGGYTYSICRVCQHKYISDEVPALGHSYNEGFCTVCDTVDPNNLPKVQGLTQTSAKQETFDISWTALKQAVKYWVYVDGQVYASTTDTSLTVRKCTPGTEYQVAVTAKLEDGTILPLSDAEVITAHTHSYVSEVTTAATCTTAGVRAYTCTLCGDSYTERILATGHSYTDQVTTAPTCTADGVRTYTCSNCDDSYTRNILATGHSYTDGQCVACGKAYPKVQGLTLVSAETNTFSICWTELEDATKYWVYVDGTVAASSAANTASITKRTPDTAYTVKVTARLADGTILALADAEALTVKTLAEEKTVFNATATAGPGSISLTWDMENCTKTWVYVGTSADALKMKGAYTGDSCTITGLAGDTKYYIQLAHCIGGKVVMSDQILEATTEAKPQTARPVEAQLSGSELTLNWETNGNSYKYWITVVRNGVSQVYSTRDTAFTVPNFDPATCTVSVRGLNSNGTYDYDAVEL